MNWMSLCVNLWDNVEKHVCETWLNEYLCWSIVNHNWKLNIGSDSFDLNRFVWIVEGLNRFVWIGEGLSVNHDGLNGLWDICVWIDLNGLVKVWGDSWWFELNLFELVKKQK